MILTVTPEDLIKRCLWNNYKKFCLSDLSETEIEKLVNENCPIALSENDAYVIGLLKVVETTNLIHRFKKDINDFLELKSIIHEEDGNTIVLINKSSLMKECIEFKNHFPEYFNVDRLYRDKILELNSYINERYKDIEQLEIIKVNRKIQGQMKTISYVHSSKINKLFKLNII